jgi:ribonuclease VapC
VSEIVVDSSAIFALMLEEADSEILHGILVTAAASMSIGTWIEIAHVAQTKFGPEGAAEVERLLQDYEIRLEDVDGRQAAAALQASRSYGRGRGKAPAVLNFGDLFSYALAKTHDLPLLYKGRDFARTDIRPALVKRSV